jgi:hypothetical protein
MDASYALIRQVRLIQHLIDPSLITSIDENSAFEMAGNRPGGNRTDTCQSLMHSIVSLF